MQHSFVLDGLSTGRVITRPVALLACVGLLVAACGSTPNRAASEFPTGRITTSSGATQPDATPGSARDERSPAGASDAPAGLDASGSPGPKGATAPQEHTDIAIGHAAGQQLLVSELLARWLHREAPKVRTYLEELVLEKLIAVEATRLGVTIDPARIETEVQKAFASIQGEIDRGQSGMTLDEFVKRRFGLDPERYRERVREERRLDLLAERCVRAWLLASERCDVRVIVVAERERIEEVQSELRKGGDFADLAMRYSEEASGENGGVIPPVVRSHTALARLAFSTPVGEVGGPVQEGGSFMLLKVDGRPEPERGRWSSVRQAVEASLAGRDIQDPEYWQWKAAMIERYEVDTSAFLSLVGQPGASE